MIALFNVLLVPLTINVFKVPPVWLGNIEGAQTIGMVLGGVFLVGLASKINPNWLIVSGIAALLLLTAGIGLAPNVIVFSVMMFDIGLDLVPLSSAAGAMMQQVVANELMGRVSSSLNVVNGVANLISMGLTGTLGAAIGLQNVFLVSSMIVPLPRFCPGCCCYCQNANRVKLKIRTLWK